MGMPFTDGIENHDHVVIFSATWLYFRILMFFGKFLLFTGRGVCISIPTSLMVKLANSLHCVVIVLACFLAGSAALHQLYWIS